MERAWLCSDGCCPDTGAFVDRATGSVCRALALALVGEIPKKAADIQVLGTSVCPVIFRGITLQLGHNLTKTLLVFV